MLEKLKDYEAQIAFLSGEVTGLVHVKHELESKLDYLERDRMKLQGNLLNHILRIEQQDVELAAMSQKLAEALERVRVQDEDLDESAQLIAGIAHRCDTPAEMLLVGNKHVKNEAYVAGYSRANQEISNIIKDKCEELAMQLVAELGEKWTG